MKTTIDINNQLLEEARKAASRDKTTVKSLVEEGLRRLLVARQERPAYSLRKATFKGRGLRKELEGSGWEKIRDRAYEGRGAWLLSTPTFSCTPTGRTPPGIARPTGASRRWRKADSRGRCRGPVFTSPSRYVTHPRIYDPPTPLTGALDQVEAWRGSPSLVLLSETEGYWSHLRVAAEGARIAGPLVHDARVAAVCITHGVRELWSADRDFSRFPALKVRNPLAG